MERARFRKARIMAAMVLAVLLLVALEGFFFLRGRVNREGVLASLRMPDGWEYMVTQNRNDAENPFSLDYLRYPGPIRRFRWTSHPYCVSFYMRPPGGAWGFCYIDHRASYWRNTAMTYDPTADVINITEDGKWRAALDRKRSTFAIGEGRPIRAVPAPQLPWAPPFPFP